MKIFNWIHRRRFPHTATHHPEVSLVEDGSSGRRSGSSIRKENIENEPLLKEDVKAGDWELDRILSIGTLAIDPLNLQEEEAEESYNYEDNEKSQAPKQDTRCEIEMGKLYACKRSDVVKTGSNEIEEVEEEIVYEKLTNLGKRVTLLDLFLADKVHEKIVAVCPADEAKEITKKKENKKKLIQDNKLPAAVGGKKGFSSKLKKFPATDADFPALKKLHKFMTRMVKRKIHPDMEARLQKKGQVKLNDDVPFGTDGQGSANSQYAADESVSLLPAQGVMV